VEVSRDIGISEQTYYRWRNEYGGMKVDQARRLKERHPDRFEEAKTYEVDGFTWVEGRTLDEIAALPKREPIPAADMTDGCAICHL
jgi:hypothetical protein